MTQLALYLHPNIKHDIDERFPNIFPFDQMVNRVRINEIDPYNCKLMVDSIQDIINHYSCNLSFEEIAFKRADYFKSLNDKIYLQYSGGIDSTVALLSILRSWDKQELERVNILCSYQSIKEFPGFWNEINHTFKGRIISSFNNFAPYLEQGIMINGEVGDQIFGSDLINIIENVFDKESIHKPWEDIIPKTLSVALFPATKPQIKFFIQLICSTFYACPFPIKTAFDWIWWYNFTTKVQHVTHRLLMMEDLTKNFHKIYPFFYTRDFQKWSMENHDLKVGKTSKSYKLEAKKFIHKYLNDENYLDKPKIGSLGKLWLVREKNFAVDEHYNIISFKQSKKYVRKLNENIN